MGRGVFTKREGLLPVPKIADTSGFFSALLGVTIQESERKKKHKQKLHTLYCMDEKENDISEMGTITMQMIFILRFVCCGVLIRYRQFNPKACYT